MGLYTVIGRVDLWHRLDLRVSERIREEERVFEIWRLGMVSYRWMRPNLGPMFVYIMLISYS